MARATTFPVRLATAAMGAWAASGGAGAAGIAGTGLVDHFDPAFGVRCDAGGHVTGWTNRAAHACRANCVDWAREAICPATLALARAARLPVVVHTVNEMAEARDLYAMGVEAITTDVPDLLAPRATPDQKRREAPAGEPGAVSRCGEAVPR